MITEMLLGLGAIVLLVALTIVLVLVCEKVGYLFGFRDDGWNDEFFGGLMWVIIIGIALFLLYLFGKFLLVNW